MTETLCKTATKRRYLLMHQYEIFIINTNKKSEVIALEIFVKDIFNRKKPAHYIKTKCCIQIVVNILLYL